MKLVPLGELMPSRIPSIDPGSFPDEQFTLWSIPSYDVGKPEQVFGRDVGSSKKTVQDGDVLLSKIVPHIRRAWKVSVSDEHRQIASSEWITFRHDDFLSDYIRHFLLTDQFHRRFMGTVAGVGGSLLRAQPKSVAKIGIPLPPLDEQRRIVGLLDRAAEIRRRADAARTKARAIIPALFLDMFGDPATNPKGWLVQPFGQGVRSIDFGISAALSDGTEHLPGTVPVIRMPNISPTGDLITEDLRFLKVSPKKRVELRLELDDVIFNWRNSPKWIGKTTVWDGQMEAIFASFLYRIRLYNDKLTPIYVKTLFNILRSRGFFESRVRQAVSQANFGRDELSSVDIGYPDLKVQQSFQKAVYRVEAQIRCLDAAAKKAEVMAAALSAEVFKTGFAAALCDAA